MTRPSLKIALPIPVPSVSTVTDPAEGQKVLRMLMLRYPEQKSSTVKMPTAADVRVFRVTPTVISLLDYSKGFGHTDLVRVT